MKKSEKSLCRRWYSSRSLCVAKSLVWFDCIFLEFIDTDCGFLTILAQTLPGLEVQDPQTNQWKSVRPLEGAFVVNLGDMAARWTNDAYRSTKHRVYNTNPKTRYSIPFFCNCNFDAPVECIVTGHDEKNTGEQNTNGGDDESSSANRSEPNVAKYEPTTAGVYILDRLGLMRLVE